MDLQGKYIKKYGSIAANILCIRYRFVSIASYLFSIVMCLIHFSATINFVNEEDVYPFKERFDGYVFVDKKGKLKILIRFCIN